MYNIRDINKELDKLKMPKIYRNRIVNLEKFFSNDITMQLSIRKDAGKTTQALILGLVLFKLYNGITTEYLRSDKEQITKGNIETLYDVILNAGYIEKLFPDQYNTIVYKSMVKKFYLAYKSVNDAGESIIEYMSDLPICHVACNEEYIRLKSSYNNPRGFFILYDEFMDTNRATQRQMIELQNNISTIGRNEDFKYTHVLMLGNNVDQYNFWWSEFTIEKEISSLKFGGYIEKKTELGTSFYCEMLEVSEEQKEKIKDKLIRFSGFNTPKMGAFNGIEAWQGSSHPHIPYLELLNKTPIYNLLFLRFHNRYVRFNLYKDADFGYYVYIHDSNPPRKKDCIVLTDQVLAFNEMYGIGEGSLNKKHKKRVQIIMSLKEDDRWYYESNSVGDFVTAYLKETRLNRKL